MTGSAYRMTLEAIRDGRIVIYPTETLYALGCDGTNRSACQLVTTAKARPEAKPLPLIIGSIKQLDSVATDFSDDAQRLADLYWPGPMSILVAARSGLAPQVVDPRGMTSVRVTPHPVAASLCVEAGVPLVATSANVNGRTPTADPSQLDTDILKAAVTSYLEDPLPYGGAPSTVVEPLGGGELRVYREGAVSIENLAASGFSVRS